MKMINRLAVPTISALCLGAGFAASASPITFEPESTAVTMETPGLLNASRRAMNMPQPGVMDEVNALLHAVDELPGFVFKLSDGHGVRMSSATTRHASGTLLAVQPTPEIRITDLAISAPSALSAQIAYETQRSRTSLRREVVRIQSEEAQLPYTPSLFSTEMAAAPETNSRGIQGGTNIAYHAGNAYYVGGATANPGVYAAPPLPSADEFIPIPDDGGGLNTESLWTFQNDLFVPGDPWPSSFEYRSGNQLAYYEFAGGVGIAGLIIGLVLNNTPNHYTPPPVPEYSSLCGYSLLCVGGGLALMRARRRRLAE